MAICYVDSLQLYTIHLPGHHYLTSNGLTLLLTSSINSLLTNNGVTEGRGATPDLNVFLQLNFERTLDKRRGKMGGEETTAKKGRRFQR